MTRPILARHAAAAASALLAALALALHLPAGQAAATTLDDVLSARVLSGWSTGHGRRMAALRLDLAPGWKTYWRSPGDAGIPPRFDWSGSENVESVEMFWPAPVVFHLNGKTTFGYREHLVLPVEVVAKDPARPMRLEARVDLGICRDICVPAAVDVAADLAVPDAPDPAIRAALAGQPVPARKAGLTAVSCTVEPIADGLRLVARLTLPRQGREETVAFETADPVVWVAEGVTRRRGDSLVATTELVAPSGQPFALDRSGVRLTVITERGAAEITGCPAP